VSSIITPTVADAPRLTCAAIGDPCLARGHGDEFGVARWS
jgi:hypothetical protein